jgi:hypothetical protein
VTDTDGGRVYVAGTWEPGPQIGIGAPVDATADLVVMDQANGIHRLVELATGRELAQLEPPDPNPLHAAFTPDGTKLVVAARNGLRVWDLRRIRTGLAKLDLDWDAPPLSAASASPATPLSIHLDLGDFPQRAQAYSLIQQADEHVNAKEHAEALAALRQAVQIAPGNAAAHSNLARLLLTGPKELRDPKQALPLARKAVELESKQSLYVTTLGMALYYTEHFADAIPFWNAVFASKRGKRTLSITCSCPCAIIASATRPRPKIAWSAANNGSRKTKPDCAPSGLRS